MGPGRLPGKLRGELTEFVGRRTELTLVRQALSAARLVTLTGPGGIGKTRLAIEAASGARRAFRDGVWLAELGSLQDPALLVPEVARSLALSDRSARWATAALADYLERRHLLLVVDQCEHLADACAVMIDALLRSCPSLHVIATSRHVLGVAGEITVPVPPLTTPAYCLPATPEELEQYEAVRLFIDRAAAVLRGFTLDRGNGAAVAEVCRRLDGIPLAIELAAVRLRSLSPAQLLSRLDSRFQLLSGGGPADQPHHRTLQATLEWSYELLTDAEQAMWRRVSVFAGSFDLNAVEAVCAVGRVTAGQTADLIDGLVAKSILLRSGQDTARYRLLDTIGDFGLRKLRGKGNERRLRLRHRRWYAAMAARQEAFEPSRAEWIAALDADHENLRAALEFCLSEPGETDAGAEMACDLWRYWETHGHLTEGRRILGALLDKLHHSAAVRPRALWVAGYLAEVQGDIAEARVLLEAGFSAAEDAGDAQALAYSSTFLGFVLYHLGEAAHGYTVVEAALRLHRDRADQVGAAQALMQIGYINLCAGQAHAAAGHFRECARLCQSSGNVWYHAHAQWGLATALFDMHADCDAVSALASTALRTFRDLDDPIGVARCLDTLAWIAAARDQAIPALILLAAVGAAWAAIPATPHDAFREHHDLALASAREALPESACQAAHASGTAMRQADAIAFALGESSRATPRPDSTPAGANDGPLTRRQQDVAIRVAQGMSNGQIGAALVISVRTVETHVQHIMDRLGVSTRAQIAAWAAARAR